MLLQSTVVRSCAAPISNVPIRSDANVDAKGSSAQTLLMARVQFGKGAEDDDRPPVGLIRDELGRPLLTSSIVGASLALTASRRRRPTGREKSRVICAAIPQGVLE